MQSFRFFQKNNDLTQVCNSIIKNGFLVFIYNLLLRNNPNWLVENFYGEVSESTLLKVIDKSLDHKRIRKLLVAIIDIVNAQSITNNVFYSLINYPIEEIKERLIVSLCHKNLTETQLLTLCHIGSDFECFFELGVLYCKSDGYSLDDIKKAVEIFKDSKFSYMHAEFFEELLDNCNILNSEKSNWIKSIRDQGQSENG